MARWKRPRPPSNERLAFLGEASVDEGDGNFKTLEEEYVAGLQRDTFTRWHRSLWCNNSEG